MCAAQLVWEQGAQLGTFKQQVSKQRVATFAWRPGITIRCRRDARCRQCTGKRLSRTIWSSFNKERMSHLCDSTVAGPTARRDNVLASKCEYPAFRYPLLLNVPDIALKSNIFDTESLFMDDLLKVCVYERFNHLKH